MKKKSFADLTVAELGRHAKDLRAAGYVGIAEPIERALRSAQHAYEWPHDLPEDPALEGMREFIIEHDVELTCEDIDAMAEAVRELVTRDVTDMPDDEVRAMYAELQELNDDDD